MLVSRNMGAVYGWGNGKTSRYQIYVIIEVACAEKKKKGLGVFMTFRYQRGPHVI